MEAIKDWIIEINDGERSGLPKRGTPEWDAQKKWIDNRVEERIQAETLQKMKKSAKEVVKDTMSKIKPMPMRDGNFDGKMLQDVVYFKKLIMGKRPVMLDDIVLFDESERKLEPWNFKGREYLRYGDYVWENNGGMKGEYMGRFDGKKIDQSESEPDLL
jgi:hypothetical protein